MSKMLKYINGRDVAMVAYTIIAVFLFMYGFIAVTYFIGDNIPKLSQVNMSIWLYIAIIASSIVGFIVAAIIFSLLFIMLGIKIFYRR